jgi:hypothetical protein
MTKIHYNVEVESMFDLHLGMPVMLLVPTEDIPVGTEGNIRETNSQSIIVEWNDIEMEDKHAIAPDGRIIDVFDSEKMHMLAFGRKVDEMTIQQKVIVQIIEEYKTPLAIAEAITNRFFLKDN